MVTDEIKDRIRSYLTHQALKSPDEVREIVQGGHNDLLAQLDGMSDTQARYKPEPEVWSVFEVLAHVIDAKRGVARICEMLARGEAPGGFGGEGEERRQTGRAGTPVASLDEARAALSEAHTGLLEFVDKMSEQMNVDTHYEHGFFGLLNCREWAVFQRIHDVDHSRQIEQVKAAPGYPG
jgi:hypothetical protein